jgi:diguanylate cyclase (GGDEF)-like protein
MISLKKYLDQIEPDSKKAGKVEAKELLPVAMNAYRSALQEMGSCSVEACPALGDTLRKGLGRLEEKLSCEFTRESVEAAEKKVQEQLQDWGRRAAEHSEQRTGEIKEILIAMARTAESVGERDQRCAKQITDVTSQLQRIANLEDLTQIRSLLKRSAAELKTSIDRMAAEGKAAVEDAKKQISGYQSKLEKAELISSCDSLTGLRSRRWVEELLQRRIEAGIPLCVAIIDLNGFKQVNDDHGHLVGDELLKQFAGELKAASRSSDMTGRWGGDEFIILLEGSMAEAKAQAGRLREWVCGDYTVEAKSGALKLAVIASFGLAEYKAGESMQELLDRADAEMYREKAGCRGNGKSSKG